MKTDRSVWITYRKPKPQAQLRLFCLPYAGGGASIFRSWSSRLPGTVEVCPVQIPGRETRVSEPPYTHVEPLVEALCEHLMPFLDLPYALFGYSMGAIIGFEFSRAVLARGLPGPCHLFVGARPGPRLPDPELNTSTLPTDEFVREVAEMGGIPEELLQNREWLEFLLPTLRTDFNLCENYRYVPDGQLCCPISAYGGIGDIKIPRQKLESWGYETASFCNVRQFQGDHFFINSSQAALLRAIAEELSTYLKPVGSFQPVGS